MNIKFASSNKRWAFYEELSSVNSTLFCIRSVLLNFKSFMTKRVLGILYGFYTSREDFQGCRQSFEMTYFYERRLGNETLNRIAGRQPCPKGS